MLEKRPIFVLDHHCPWYLPHSKRVFSLMLYMCIWKCFNAIRIPIFKLLPTFTNIKIRIVCVHKNRRSRPISWIQVTLQNRGFVSNVEVTNVSNNKCSKKKRNNYEKNLTKKNKRKRIEKKSEKINKKRTIVPRLVLDGRKKFSVGFLSFS